MDGGTMWDVNLDSAVNYCLDQGYTEEQIIVDILVCYGDTSNSSMQIGGAMANFRDAHRIHHYYNNLNSLTAEMEAYPNINIRSYFAETTDDYAISTGCPYVGAKSELDFSSDYTWCLQQAGRRDAQTMLGLGQENIVPAWKNWLKDKEMKKEYPQFRDFLNEKFDI